MLSFTVADTNSTVTKLMALGAELDGRIKYEIHGKIIFFICFCLKYMQETLSFKQVSELYRLQPRIALMDAYWVSMNLHEESSSDPGWKPCCKVEPSMVMTSFFLVRAFIVVPAFYYTGSTKRTSLFFGLPWYIDNVLSSRSISTVHRVYNVGPE